MQRHDDEVRNNVIYPPSVIWILAPSVLSPRKSDGSGDKNQKTAGKKKKKERKEKKKKGEVRQTSRGGN